MELQSKPGALQQREDIDAQWKWRLEDIFETDAAWEATYQALSQRLPGLDVLPSALERGKAGILEAVRTSFEVKRTAERLIGYASMRRDEDNRNPVYQGLTERAQALTVSAESKLAFLEPALLALPEVLLAECIEDPAFAEYDVYLHRVQRDRAHTLPADQEKLLALAGEVLDAPSTIYDMLTDADMRFPTILDEKGEPVEITHGRFRSMLLSHDRRVRREAFEAMMETYHKFGNTIATAYAKSVKGDCFEAKIRNFDSALAMVLHPDEVPQAVYDSLIEAMHAHLPALNRYVLQRKKDLGLDEIHLYDLYVNPIQDFDLPLTYPEAYDTVLEALAPLGEDYVNVLREARAQGWADVYESEGKTSGAYSWGVYGVHPYVLLNHQNVLDGTSTLAHELGHAMHTHLANAALPYAKANYSLFAAEVASTVNEILLSCYLMDRYPQREAQAFLINELLEGFRGTVYRQTLFAEFERESHAMAERDEALTGQALSDLYYGIYQRYYGESCVIDECVRHEWMRIPHFYRAFYVYKYATGFSAAVYIARRILREGAPAVAEYMRFLKAGGSLPPIEALRLAGVDMAEKTAVNEALDWFGELVDRFIALQQS